MPSFEALKKLFRELGIKIDTSITDIASETTLSTINGKITKCDTDNVKISDSVGYNDAMDSFKIILYNDQVGIAKEQTLQSIDNKITKCNTDKVRVFYSDIAYNPYQDYFKVHDDRAETIWDWAVGQDKAFVGGKVVNIASAGSQDFLFANPSGSGKTLKVRLLNVFGGAEGQVDIYAGSYGETGSENIVRTSVGTSIDILHKKVGGTTTSQAIFEYGGTYTLNTTSHTEGLIPGGSGNFATGGSATQGLAGEILEGYAILIRVTNTSASTANYGVRIEWWEE